MAWIEMGTMLWEVNDRSPIEALLDLLVQPAFFADALCREYADVVTWFPGPGQSPEPAQEVCARCRVGEECRTWAMGQWPRPLRHLGRSDASRPQPDPPYW